MTAFARSKQFRAWVRVLVVLVALGEPTRAALHAASAQQGTEPPPPPCTGTLAMTEDGFVCVYPAHPVLNLDESVFGATPEQAAALRNFEEAAIEHIIKDHGLTDADHDAVQTWARYDVLSELYAMFQQAIDDDTRSTDQQHVVNWLSAIMKGQTVSAAENAAREYVKWAGLNADAFETLLASNPSEIQLRDFLNDFPQFQAFCGYAPPSPYSSEYSAASHQICLSQGLSCQGASFGLSCNPPTPSYDQFVKWGKATSSFEFLNSAQYARTSVKTAAAFGLAAGVAAAVVAGTVLPGSMAIATTSSAAIIGPAIAPYAASVGVAGFALGVFLIVIIAVIIAVMVGAQVINASELPGQLAELITESKSSTYDANKLTADSSGLQTLFTILIGAALPEPDNQSCDNTGPGLPPPGIMDVKGRLIYSDPNCLNPTPIPFASATDSQFEVRNGSNPSTLSPTISYVDGITGAATTARLSKNWFITAANGVKAQTLALQFVDEDSKKRFAWVMGDATRGYKFITFSPPDIGDSIDIETCAAKKICSTSDTLTYLGIDGLYYSAKVRGHLAATGTPKVSAAVEGSPVTFAANGVAPPAATGAITYAWRFQKDDCGPQPCTTSRMVGFETVFDPVYEDPVAGATASHTWRQHGLFSVELTAIDANGTAATKTFDVNVENVAPVLSIDAESCFDLCEPTRITGTFDDAGEFATLTVTVLWGDGTFSWNRVGPFNAVAPANPVTVTKVEGKYVFVATHTYATGGKYYGSVHLTDGNTLATFFGLTGVDTATFVADVFRIPQTINFPALATRTYGDAPLAITATGGGSGQPVNYFVTGAGSICTVSTGLLGAAVTILRAGTCTITATQAGLGDFDAAPNVTRSFTIQPATLRVIPSSGGMSYDGTVPSISHRYEGFVNGDDQGDVNKLATCSTNAPSNGAPGDYTATCTGAEDDNYTFNYEARTFTIRKADTRVTPSPASAVAVKGQPVTILAMVEVTTGAGNPTGTVQFKDGVTPIAECAAVPLTNFVATCTTSSLGVGARIVSAVYGGDINFNGSETGASVTVGKASTSTDVSASASPSVVAKPVTFTSNVTVSAPGSGSATGPVTFFDGATRLGTGQLAVVAGKVQATFSTSSLTLGRHSITASYGGSGDFTPSTSAALIHHVNTDLGRFPRLANGALNIIEGNLKNAWLVGADLTGAAVVDSNFTSANLTGAILVGATLSGNFKDANFSDANLANVRFTNANLVGARGLNTATLTNVIWTNTICPNGKNSTATGGSCVGQW